MVLYIDDHGKECSNVPELLNSEVDYFREVAVLLLLSILLPGRGRNFTDLIHEVEQVVI